MVGVTSTCVFFLPALRQRRLFMCDSAHYFLFVLGLAPTYNIFSIVAFYMSMLACKLFVLYMYLHVLNSK